MNHVSPHGHHMDPRAHLPPKPPGNLPCTEDGTEGPQDNISEKTHRKWWLLGIGQTDLGSVDLHLPHAIS
jgi:hypothetical protein